jgi:long-chain fatty acid transport protein
MKRISYFLTVMIGCLVLINSAYSANVADTYGLSPKGMGMGNAMTAHVNDWTSVFYNIAGLGRTRHFLEGASRSELYVGYLITMPQTGLDIPQRYSETRTYATNADKDLGFGSFILGTALDLNSICQMPHIISSSRFGLALSIGDDLTIAKVRDIEPQTHNYLRFGKEAQQMLLITGVGMGFSDDSFGIGLGIKSTFGGNGVLLLEDVNVGTDPQTPRVQSNMDLELQKPSWVAGLYIDFRKLNTPLNRLSLGLAYKQKSFFKLAPLNTLSVVEVGGIPLNLNLSVFDYYQPTSFTAGFSYILSDRCKFAMDIEYQTWSDYKVSNNQSVNYGGILPDLYDILIPKIGLEYKANPKTNVYLGYYYQPSFIPDDAVDGEVNWLENDKHVASIGISRDTGKWAVLKKPMVLHAGYQFQYLVDREVKKVAPTTSNPNYSYGGIVHTMMLGLSF